MKQEPIKSWNGTIIGYICYLSGGDKMITDFHGRMLGFYRANPDHTTDFNGCVIGKGDQLMRLLNND